jgi:AcrB/AcrD/AcrF family
MWLVRVALERPYTFVVLAMLVLIMSAVAITNTPTDIFPNINIPVVAVDWTYTGLNPEELEGRLTSVYERVLTATVDNIQHLESTTVNGQAIVKIFLYVPALCHAKRMNRPPHCFSFSKDNRSFVAVLSPKRGNILSMLCWCARGSKSVIASVTSTT